MEQRILFVAPFEGLYEQARSVIDEQFAECADNIRVVKGDLHECIAVVKESVERGVDVVVSRGGTASLIKDIVAVPVVPIQVTTIDILRALNQSAACPQKVGIAGFQNVIYGREELEQLLDVAFFPIMLTNEDEAFEKIGQAVEQGVRLIIGDAISAKIANAMGIEGIVIRSGREAICKAIEEARLIAGIRREEQEKSALLRLLLDQSAEGVVAVDTRSRITVFNTAAEAIFGVPAHWATGRPLHSIAPQLECNDQGLGDDVWTFVQKIGGKSFTVKKSRLVIQHEEIGVMYHLQNIHQIQKLEQNIRKHLSKRGLVARIHMDDIVGVSAVCRQLKQVAVQYAVTQSTILVTGQSGTGKEMLVQSIHNASCRANGPFVAVNCAALPEALLESELFGYEEGAFTGAKRGGRQGLFELAHGGTLFLDEIGEMPLALQARLLRVLQEKAVMHLGGSSIIPVDVRIIAATNQDLDIMVEAKAFRQDLYYRLNILRIHMPPLQDRIEDIGPIVKAMIANMRPLNTAVIAIDDAALQYLQSCSWPGNIRQLANVVERAMLLSQGPVILRQDIVSVCDDGQLAAGCRNTLPDSDNLVLLEQQTLQRVLCEEEFNYTRAAARLGIHRTTLYRKLNRYK